LKPGVNALLILILFTLPAFGYDYISPQLTPKPPRNFYGEWVPLLWGMNPSGSLERQLPCGGFKIDGEWIRRSGYVNLGDFLDDFAGIRAEEIPGQEAILEDYSGRRMVILMDGIPLDPASEGMIPLNSIPLENIDYLEVYEGSLCALYGDCSQLVNIITKHERVEQTDAWFIASDGSFNTERYKFAFSYSLPHYDLTVSGNRLLFGGYSANSNYSGGNLSLVGNLYTTGMSTLGGFSWFGASQGTGQDLSTGIKDEIGYVRLFIAPQWRLDSWSLGGELAYLRKTENQNAWIIPYFKLKSMYAPPGSPMNWYSSLYALKSSAGLWAGGMTSSLGLAPSTKANIIAGFHLQTDENGNYQISPVAGLSFSPKEEICLFADAGLDYKHPSQNDAEKDYSFLSGFKWYMLNYGQFSLAGFYSSSDGADSLTGALEQLQLQLPYYVSLGNSVTLQNRATPTKPKLTVHTSLDFNPKFKKDRFSLYAGLEHTYYSSKDISLYQYQQINGKSIPHYHLWDLRFSLRVISLEVYMLVENLMDTRLITPYGQFPPYPRVYRVGFSWQFLN